MHHCSFFPTALASLVLLGLGSSCALLRGSLSKPPTIVVRSWQRETVLVESGREVLGEPSIFLDGKGQPAVALSDRSFYVGMQSVALGRRGAEGWRVEFPLTPSAWRVCGRAGTEDEVIVTHGDLEGPLSAASWDGQTTADAQPGPCLRSSSTVREATGPDGVHKLERSNERRTLWHRAPAGGGKPCEAHDAEPGHEFAAFDLALDGQGRPQIAVFEHPEGRDPGPGRLRHASCTDGTWTSSVIEDGVFVRSVRLTLDPAGQPHLAYVVDQPEGQRLTYAVPADAGVTPPASPDADARVVPAVEACLRVYPQIQTLTGTGIEMYQTGDPFRCAVLERDPEASTQALAVLQTRCDASELDACAVAASLQHWLMGHVSIVLEVPRAGTSRIITEWQGLRPSGVSEDPSAAVALYAKACEGGDARACLHAAALLPREDERRLPWATTACKDGSAHACALAVLQTGLQPSTPKGKALATTANETMRKACDAGDMAACASYGVMLYVGGDDAGARAATTRACDAQVQTACTNLAALPR